MQENKTQLITYIGKKSPKLDTVAGTGIIWEGYGDTQEVMHSAAVKLLQHTDVWVRQRDFKGSTPDADYGLSNVEPKPEPEAEPELNATAPIDLKNAIAILFNENNEDNFTRDGAPKVDAVNALTEAKYSADEIKAALKELNIGK